MAQPNDFTISTQQPTYNFTGFANIVQDKPTEDIIYGYPRFGNSLFPSKAITFRGGPEFLGHIRFTKDIRFEQDRPPIRFSGTTKFCGNARFTTRDGRVSDGERKVTFCGPTSFRGQAIFDVHVEFMSVVTFSQQPIFNASVILPGPLLPNRGHQQCI